MVWTTTFFTWLCVSTLFARSMCNFRKVDTAMRRNAINTYAVDDSPNLIKLNLDKQFITVALPAFVALAADPLASLVDSIYVGRLSPVDQAGMGIAISAQYSIAKLYNDPLLKTSTSLVAGKNGQDLIAAVKTSLLTATVIGTLQFLVFFFFSGRVLQLMNVPFGSEMRKPALAYLKWRALGIPAATTLLVTTSIFRGRGDTKTPLYCTSLGNLVNIILDPILIFSCGMGCAGAGAATAISQWVTVVPLLYLLQKDVPFDFKLSEFTGTNNIFEQAFKTYVKAGGLIFFRTVSKIGAYTVTSAAAAKLGTVAMAAYALTFNLGFATSQLCEAISVAAQVLLARDMPFDSPRKLFSAGHVIRRALLLGVLVSGGLSIFTWANMDSVLGKLTTSSLVRDAAHAIMPVVLLTQLLKGLSYATGGIILGGLDWGWSTAGMTSASVVCILLTQLLPASLWNIWLALAAFMGTQVICALTRLLSDSGPWHGLRRHWSTLQGESDIDSVPKVAM